MRDNTWCCTPKSILNLSTAYRVRAAATVSQGEFVVAPNRHAELSPLARKFD